MRHLHKVPDYLQSPSGLLNLPVRGRKNSCPCACASIAKVSRNGIDKRSGMVNCGGLAQFGLILKYVRNYE